MLKNVMRTWTFNVECCTLPGEVVCVTGSCPELGNWKVDKLVKLEPDGAETPGIFARFGGEMENTWSGKFSVPDGVDISYRFCICCFVTLADDSGTKMVVRKWETNLHPRRIGCHEQCDLDKISKFGFISPSTSEESKTQRGWLTDETVVQLKLFGEKTINVWKKKHKNKAYYVKVTPVRANRSAHVEAAGSDESQSLDMSETRDKWNSWPIVEVAKLTSDDCVLRSQSQFGLLYEENTFILFQAQVLDLPTVAFLVDIFARPQCESSSQFHRSRQEMEPAELIGSCYIMPNHFTSTSGKIKEAIIAASKFEVIGEVSVEFLVIKPTVNAGCDFAMSFARHWKPHWTGLDVGHRGLGASFTNEHNCSHMRENTIASLKYAHAHGADMVEFDIQLSKDLVPVIYHDFELCTMTMKKDEEEKELVPTQLKNLTLKQLRGLKIHHQSEISGGVKTFNTEEANDVDHAPIPTLEEALKVIDDTCGFNIELKWDMMLKDGSNECHFPFEINLFLDVVIKTVLEHGSRRKIVFSSFNPDVCSMIRLKQNRYPVLLLTQGINTKYDDYMDPRTWTIDSGSCFVAMAEILGVNVMAEDIQRDPSQVQKVKERGQVIFVWTDDQNDKGTVQYLKNAGVDGIVYDRMDVNNSKEVKESVFMCTEEVEVEKAARSPKSGCSCSPQRSPGSPGTLAANNGDKMSSSTVNQNNIVAKPPTYSFAGLVAENS